MIRKPRGFTLVELMVVVGVIAILIGLLLPSIQSARRTAITLNDATYQMEIHKAMLSWATGDEKNRLPTPGLIKRMPVNLGGGPGAGGYVPGQGLEDGRENNSLKLWSSLVAKQLIIPAIMISPAETNPIFVICENYNFNAINPTAAVPVFWDEANFKMEVTKNPGLPTDVAHCSFAHQALAGQRKKYYWRATSGSDRAIMGNRAPYKGNLGGTTTYSGFPNSYRLSYTLRFHTPDDQWSGNIVYGDAHTVFEKSMVPDQIQYECGNITLRKDNLYSHLEFTTCNPPTGPTGGAFGGGDNYMCLHTGQPENPANPTVPPLVAEMPERLTNGDLSTGPN